MSLIGSRRAKANSGAVLLAFIALFFMSAAHAAISSGSAQDKSDPVDFVRPVLAPFAYTRFCQRYATDCEVKGRAFRKPRPVALNADRSADLKAVNVQVNRSIAPKRYANDTTFDTWRIGPDNGDCNDYAVTKRHELLRRGWPTRALLLSEVVTAWGEHHLVLLVVTDQGNYVLDNLNAQIRPWSLTNYQWVRVQMPSDPALWSTISAPIKKG